MNVTRKEFLFTVAAGVAGTAMHPLSAITVAAGPAPVARGFAGLVGRTFHVTTADSRGAIDVVLEAYDERSTQDGTHQFSLTFVAPGGERLTEGTYTVEEAQMGRFQLFVVPTRRDGQGRAFYRADFNLLTKKQ
jgi:hypothetical protein